MLREATSREDKPKVHFALEGELLACTNAFRQWRGCSPVSWHADLCANARAHAEAMAAGTAPFSHAGARERFANESYHHFAENLARAEGVENLAVAVVDGWIGSPGHCRNLLGPFNAMGLGVAFRSSKTDGVPSTIVFVTQLLAYVHGGPVPPTTPVHVLERILPALQASFQASSGALRPALAAGCVGALATGPVGAVLGSAAVFGLEVGAGLKVVTVPKVAQRIVSSRVGVGTVQCTHCGARTAPLLRGTAQDEADWSCDRCQRAPDGADHSGDWWLVNRVE